MKLRFTIFLITISMLIVSSTNLVLAADHDDEHAHEGTSVHTSSAQCDTSTTTLLIIGGGNGALKFDKQEYNVEKNTCIEITFQNVEPSLDHDMNIDEVTGTAGIAVTHLHQANNLDGPNGDGTITLNILTPDTDTEFLIYCSVPGHQAGGMESILIVGAGNPDKDEAPAFELFGAIFSLSVIAFLMKRRTK